MKRKSCRGCWRKWPQRVRTSRKYHKTSFNLPKGQLALVSEWSSYKFYFLQPCLSRVWRRFLMTKWRSWMTQALIRACCLITSVIITFYGKVKKLRYCERITNHWLTNITGIVNDRMSWRSVICRNLLIVVEAKMMIQTFVITARRRSCLMSWKQHMST